VSSETVSVLSDPSMCFS